MYIGPFEALSVVNSKVAPSSIKIFSGAMTLLLDGIGLELLSLVIKLKSSWIASPFFEKISQVCSIRKISSLNSKAS